jgi:hypothetical protein
MTIESPPQEKSADFLDAIQQSDRGNDTIALAFSNKVLLAILREIRKTHPSQRCVVIVDYTNAGKVLDSAVDTATIKFLSQGKPVLSQYLVVCNNTDVAINVALNEPVSINPATTFATGIRIPGGGTLQIPVEIENIQIRLTTNAAGPLGIIINNAPTGVPTAGEIQVYGWTIPNSDKDDTE